MKTHTRESTVAIALMLAFLRLCLFRSDLFVTSFDRFYSRSSLFADAVLSAVFYRTNARPGFYYKAPSNHIV